MRQRMVSERRRKRERGQEIIEFCVVLVLFVPLLIGTFVAGMSLIRSITANQVCRDLDSMYIHGGDFSSYPMEQEAQRLAQGMNLQLASSSSFPTAHGSADSDAGSGLVTATQIMWVGSTTDPNCVAVGASNCTNHNNFVFLQRIQFGNITGLATTYPSSLGNPGSGAVLSTAGVVQNPVTDSNAKLPSPAQTNMQNLWQTTNNGQQPLVDGQVIYVMEVFFQNPDILGTFTGPGVYARYFF